MAEHTTNLNLALPSYLEDADIAVLNDNFTAIDTAVAAKANTSSLATVATSGAYDDLSGKPTIPIVDSELDAQSTNAIQNAAVFAALLGFFPLSLGNEIPSTVTALSALKEAGIWFRLSGFNSFTDLPPNWGSCAAGNVIVLPTTTAWRFRQILLPSAPVNSAAVPYFWTRYMTGGSKTDPSTAVWQKWVEFAGTTLAV